MAFSIREHNLDFSNPDRNPLPLANAMGSTLDGNTLVTTAVGDPTVRFNPGTAKPATFVRADVIP
jgi:hypothetical protein